MNTSPGWKVFDSLILELDLALWAIRDYSMGSKMPAEFAALLRSLPEDWLAELPAHAGAQQYVLPLETLSWLAGTLFETDYGRATLPVRALTPETARQTLSASGSSPAQGLVEAGVQSQQALYRQAGLALEEPSALAQHLRGRFERAAHLLGDEAARQRFWHWLDRFYFEYYHPWRQQRLDAMQGLRRQAQAALGSLEHAGAPPSLDWLPAQNPLLRYPQLRQAVEEGRFQACFWVEPFGMADSMALYPGMVCVSFAQPGALYENFLDFATDVARRTHALADPTRLVILRLIRHFGMVNTEIASYLGISRPTVSVHAKILREAGLIASQQDGREVRHTLKPDELHRLFRDLALFLDLPPEDGEKRPPAQDK